MLRCQAASPSHAALYRLKWRALLPALLLLFLALSSELPANEAISLIAHPSGNTSRLSLKELRAIYTMRLREWPGTHQTIKVFVLRQDTALHAQFCKDLLNAYPHQLQAGWDRLVYSGTGEAPEAVDSEEKMLEAVARTPGAIGYVSSRHLLEVKPHDSVKPITVQ